MEIQATPDDVINDLLDQNKQLTLQVSVLKSVVAQLQKELSSHMGYKSSQPVLESSVE